MRAGLLLAAYAFACGTVWQGLAMLDRTYPPPVDAPIATSVEVVDADGALLRAFATDDGVWRFDIALSDLDPQLIDMLVAYEDRRFYDHHGVDLAAMLRASWQFATHGRIVSGGSTITMQLARLMEPRDQRSLSAKIFQIARAIQIERRLSKDEILRRYLMLAPYGGNLEGIRAASLAWYGKEPKRLGVGEAALLAALPQSPERRRPDRYPTIAEAGRDRVLARMVEASVLDERESTRAKRDLVPHVRQAMPLLAAHASYAAIRRNPDISRHELTIRRRIQEGLEEIAARAARNLGPRVTVSMVMADARTGDIVGEVGSADYFDASRSGWIDMTNVVRSPGSTLKPFIYGLAFEEGLVAQETIIEDRPASFGGYRPRNFDMQYQGDVSIRQALQMSLNVPAVRLLDAVGPARLTMRFRQSGAKAVLPKGEAAGLAIALGGVGMSLKDLVQLYTAFPGRGQAVTLSDRVEDRSKFALLDPAAAWQISDILLGVTPPEGARRMGIAYKTGTSYGYRDAWSVGFDGRYVLGVWVGRPDGGAVPGISGFATAAPILFDAFKRSGVAITALPHPPAGALRLARNELPVTQNRFSTGLDATAPRRVTEPAPAIVFPPDGARVEISASDPATPVTLKLQGGRAPFRWLANGAPLPEISRRRTLQWTPTGGGFSTLVVIDAAGRTASVRFFVE